MNEVIIKRCSPDAIMPYYDYNTGGWKLYSNKEYIIPAHDRTMVYTDIHIDFPPGFHGKIVNRNRIAYECSQHKYVDVETDCIHHLICSDIHVLMINHGDKDITITKGSNIAQIIFEKSVDNLIINNGGILQWNTNGNGITKEEDQKRKTREDKDYEEFMNRHSITKK